MTATSEGNDQPSLQLDDHPLCRMKSSSGVRCNARPWWYVRSGNRLIPTCRNHVSKMLQFATSSEQGYTAVVDIGQVATYMRNERRRG